jgi:hypothetical protein
MQMPSWKSGRPRPINYTMFRTKISLRGICGIRTDDAGAFQIPNHCL